MVKNHFERARRFRVQLKPIEKPLLSKPITVGGLNFERLPSIQSWSGFRVSGENRLNPYR